MVRTRTHTNFHVSNVKIMYIICIFGNLGWRQGQGHFDKSARVMHYFFRGGYPPKYQIHGNLQLKYL